jgi:hypothetical protein
MKLHEKARHFESLAIRHKHHLNCLLEALNDQIQWTPLVEYKSAFGTYWVQYAWIKRSKLKSIVARHIKYANPQVGLQYRFDSWQTSTLDEVLKEPEDYGWRQLPDLDDELKPDPEPKTHVLEMSQEELNRLVDEVYDSL